MFVKYFLFWICKMQVVKRKINNKKPGQQLQNKNNKKLFGQEKQLSSHQKYNRWLNDANDFKE